MEGNAAEINPFRFSSEYLDDDLGLVYYNYRYYNVLDGRWINRDPMAENAGFNLYCFVSNGLSIDYLGLIDWDKELEKLTNRLRKEFQKQCTKLCQKAMGDKKDSQQLCEEIGKQLATRIEEETRKILGKKSKTGGNNNKENGGEDNSITGSIYVTGKTDPIGGSGYGAKAKAKIGFDGKDFKPGGSLSPSHNSTKEFGIGAEIKGTSGNGRNSWSAGAGWNTKNGSFPMKPEFNFQFRRTF